ncbi:hypothetical protein JRQ81_014541 [Phrynocephalus forsythii]|uniref:RGS domain-containing protein n=1 Tax=Phrynocephalus forsythii TaxID=171643 RepID=A0A9Q0XXJ3_9SAUR|nr:hypothetical protein JRQ81_014541 [Phrynocephalus forsythii]
MENPFLLSPQLNAASRIRSLYKTMKSMNKDGGKMETKSRNRLSLLQKPELYPNDSLDNFETLTKIPSRESHDTVKKWAESFDNLITQKAGVDAFTTFLRSEFSEENIEFWMACEDYKKSNDMSQLPVKAKTIYQTFIEKEAPKEVNLDFNTKLQTTESIRNPTLSTFDAAQTKIYALMEQDCYPRFLRSNFYLDLLHGRPHGHTALRRRSRSFTFNEFKDAQPDFSIWL